MQAAEALEKCKQKQIKQKLVFGNSIIILMVTFQVMKFVESIQSEAFCPSKLSRAADMW